MQSKTSVRRLLSFVAMVALVGGVTAAASQPAGNGNVVIRWHEIAIRLMVDPGPVIDSRAFSIYQAAIHDAVNSVERRYSAYTVDVSSPGASVAAAVATAAHDVLVALSPSQREKIEAEYASALAELPDGPAKRDGVALGRLCAQANLDRRAGDDIPVVSWPPTSGPITQPVYVPTGKPGDYDFTPPFDRPPLGPVALFPGWGRLQPFGANLAKGRLDGPPPLSSLGYAFDLNYLKTFGSLTSTTRTADQTQTAFFWFEPFPTWNQIANTALRKNHADIWEAARVLALVNFAMADSGIACFRDKYRFRFWRPYTAIRRADEDDNRLTEPDTTWLPLLWTAPEVIPPTFLIPPIPEYPSAAATISAAAAEVLILNFGDNETFASTSPFLPGVTRQYTSFTQAAIETGMSRVFGGIHFLRAVHDGYWLGRGVGRSVGRLLPAASGSSAGR
jgi:hypothetical protein